MWAACLVYPMCIVIESDFSSNQDILYDQQPAWSILLKSTIFFKYTTIQ